MRKRLEAVVGRAPCAHLPAESQVVRGDLGVVLHHLDGLGHRAELLDHALPHLGAEVDFRNPYALYRPHGTVAAGVVVMAAGGYELTPAKRHFRLKCHENTCSGWVFGLDCVGSSIGLMAMLVVLGIMSIPWMAVMAVVMVAQKVLPTRAIIDVPFALVIVGLGLAILAAPASVPGLMPGTGHMPTM